MGAGPPLNVAPAAATSQPEGRSLGHDNRPQRIAFRVVIGLPIDGQQQLARPHEADFFALVMAQAPI
jgi:hypothetical protein